MSTESELEKRKRGIFEGMSSRRQQKILKKGYDKWDPFLAPKEPPFYRQEERDRARDAGENLRLFFHKKQTTASTSEPLSLEYVEGAREICNGLLRDKSDRFQAMFDFSIWLKDKRG